MVGYPEGSDLTLMNTIYIKPKKRDDGRYTAPIMNILYKDNNTGQKHIKEIKNPTYRFYVANENVYLDAPEFFISEDMVHPVEVPYDELEREIAKRQDVIDSKAEKEAKLIELKDEVVALEEEIASIDTTVLEAEIEELKTYLEEEVVEGSDVVEG